MTQPSLLDLPFSARPRRKPIRQTSLAAYALAREHFKGRRGNVLRWLAHYQNGFGGHVPTTSAELAVFVARDHADELPELGLTYLGQPHLDGVILYVRRGLSDILRTSATIETVPDGARPCTVSGRDCLTWRIVSR